MTTLPTPQVRSCEFEEIFQPSVAAMRLDWGSNAAAEHRSWNLPDGITLGGPIPARFGIHIHRHSADSYAVHVVWNHAHFAWPSLSSRDLQDSCLGSLLAAMGSDLQDFLDQPVTEPRTEAGPGKAPRGAHRWTR